MGIIVRQSIKNSIISYFGVALGFFTTLWLYPTILNQEQYGLTRVLLSFSLIGTQIANLGMSNTIIRYFPYFKDKEKRRQTFLLFSLFVPLAGFLLLSGGIVIFQEFILDFYREKSELFLDFYFYLIPLIFFELYFNIITNYIRGLYDTVTASFLKDLLIRILVILILLLYLFGWIDFDQFVVLFVANYGIILIFLVLHLLYIHPILVEPDLKIINKTLAQNVASYGLFTFLGGVASIIVGHIDLIMLSSLSGLEDTAVYAIAFYIGSVIAIPRKSILKISTPIVANAFKNNNYELIDDIYKRSSLNLLLMGVLIFCGVWANLDNLIEILPENYAYGEPVILIVGLAYTFDMATGINGSIILYSKYYRTDLYFTIILVLLTASLNFLLIPLYGIIGAAIATAASIGIYNLIKFLYVWIKLDMQPFQLKMMTVILIGALAVFIPSLVEQVYGLYIDLAVRSFMVAFIYLGLIYFLKISDDVNRIVYQLFDKIYFKSDS